MSSPLASLEPRLVWSHFDGIRNVPRPSKSEEKIAAHVQGWARGRGLGVKRDAIGNLCVRVPATPGHEGAPVVILQGHLDMVCEKNADVERDFMTQGIDVYVDGDWVRARGTTLGADNGIGLAAAMAVADDPAAVHGPLEILCTVDEETGLTGAKQLDASILTGKVMVNLDTEEDGAVYIGCAGGADIHMELPVSRRRGVLGSLPVKLVVRGLRGGHSGLNIIDNRGNAIKLATRVLLKGIEAGLDLDLVSVDGGSKHNAIPREAFVVVRVLAEGREKLAAILTACLREFREEFGAMEPELDAALEAVDEGAATLMVLRHSVRDRLLRLLCGIPHGVLAMSREVPGLVETSNNLAVVTTEPERVRVVTSHRSSVMPALYAAGEQVRSVGLASGATVEVHDAYPGWKPNPASPVVQKTVEVYERLAGKKPGIKAIHAGLECGLLIEKVPGLDAVSIGPEIHNPHSPDEAVQISTVDRFYRVLTTLLREMA
jgi:dipeptidase D